jgi:hypothetical protein
MLSSLKSRGDWAWGAWDAYTDGDAAPQPGPPPPPCAMRRRLCTLAGRASPSHDLGQNGTPPTDAERLLQRAKPPLRAFALAN